MKGKILLSLVAIFLVGCIPSLHPIFTEDNRVVDDRIVGNWIKNVEDEVQLKNFKNTLDSCVDQKRTLSLNDFENSLHRLFQDSTDMFSSLWQFERAFEHTITSEEPSIFSDHKSTSINFRNVLPEKHLRVNSKIESKELPFYILKYLSISGLDKSEALMIVNLTSINGNLYADFLPHEDYNEYKDLFDINRIYAHTFTKVEFQNGHLVIKGFNSDYIEELIENKRIRLKHERTHKGIVLTASTENLRAFISKYGSDEKLFLDDDLLFAI